MADILIRGMEMPQRCKACRFCGFGGRRSELNVCMFTGESQPKLSQERMSKCPLVPVPEGHGKLIDGHKLYRALFATECGNIAADRDSEGWPKVLTYEAVKKAIQDATIIVPAEGGEADGN